MSSNSIEQVSYKVRFFSRMFIFFNINLFILIGGYLLYNIVLVLPYINMNPPRVYTCSASWSPLPPPSPYHPSGSSQCTSPKHPVSCIEPGLAICFLYDIIHVSMPFSQITPPSPSPTEMYRTDCLYFLQPKMEKLYTVSKNKTGSWLWLRSWTAYGQIQT